MNHSIFHSFIDLVCLGDCQSATTTLAKRSAGERVDGDNEQWVHFEIRRSQIALHMKIEYNASTLPRTRTLQTSLMAAFTLLDNIRPVKTLDLIVHLRCSLKLIMN